MHEHLEEGDPAGQTDHKTVSTDMHADKNGGMDPKE